MLVSKAKENEKLKCLIYDFEDQKASFVLYKKDSTWKHKGRFTSEEQTKEFYRKVKSFKSKPEMDMWCALSNVEYEMADHLFILQEHNWWDPSGG